MYLPHLILKLLLITEVSGQNPTHATKCKKETPGGFPGDFCFCYFIKIANL
jgi:hypothetical protein